MAEDAYVGMRECCICCDTKPLTEGLECAGGEPHFICDGCLTTHVADMTTSELREREVGTHATHRGYAAMWLRHIAVA